MKKKQFRRKGTGGVSSWQAVLLAGLLACGSLWAADETKKLAVKSVDQEHEYWCWAACAEMVIEFLHPGTNVDQCALAKLDYVATVNCCNPAASGFGAQCNSRGEFPEVSFQKNGLRYKFSEDRLSWKKIKEQ